MTGGVVTGGVVTGSAVRGRVEEHLRRRRDEGRKLLVPYVTGGITDDWTDHVREYARAGADAVEIGLPFSDPILDGPVIQEASHRALSRGVTVRSILDDLTGVEVEVPLIAMTYGNLLVRPGPAAFCRDLAAAGVTGLIVPDVPIDEVDEVEQAARDSGVDLVLLVAPATPAPRRTAIARRSRGFVYAVTVMGATGERDRLAGSAGDLARELRATTDLPVLLGFGISTPEQAAEAAAMADGVVVASALMTAILAGAEPRETGRLVATLRSALDAGPP